jgi:hypothetical protein
MVLVERADAADPFVGCISSGGRLSSNANPGPSEGCAAQKAGRHMYVRCRCAKSMRDCPKSYEDCNAWKLPPSSARVVGSETFLAARRSLRVDMRSHPDEIMMLQLVPCRSLPSLFPKKALQQTSGGQRNTTSVCGLR